MQHPSPSAPNQHEPKPGLGIALMLMGMLMFSLNDTMGKMLVATYSIGQVLLIRSLAALFILAPFLWCQGLPSLVRIDRPWLQALRVALSTFEVFCFYYAVIYYPLADVMTWWLACPIYIAALSPFLLGEKVGWRRWTAIAIGFAGVVIALQPATRTIDIAMLVSIIGPLAFAIFIIAGRSLRATPDITLVFWQIIGAGIAGIAIAPFDWTPLTAKDTMLLGLLGIVAMLAHVLVNRALKLADAATTAPLQYTLLFWAIVFGWVFFGDIPNGPMILGASLIVASGIFIVWREQALKRQNAKSGKNA
jgi:drug/metabolite transporter (DMT)-like permease